MDMKQIRKECLITQVGTYGVLWGNKALQDLVCQAITSDDMATLVDIIDKLATKANEQKVTLARQSAAIDALRHEVTVVNSALAEQEQATSSMMKPPALKDDLDTQKMWTLYQRYGSFSKIGNLMGCAGKTVSRRLRTAGYPV